MRQIRIAESVHVIRRDTCGGARTGLRYEIPQCDDSHSREELVLGSRDIADVTYGRRHSALLVFGTVLASILSLLLVLYQIQEEQNVDGHT